MDFAGAMTGAIHVRGRGNEARPSSLQSFEVRGVLLADGGPRPGSARIGPAAAAAQAPSPKRAHSDDISVPISLSSPKR